MGKPVQYSCLKAPEATQNWPTSSGEDLDVLQVLILFELGDNWTVEIHSFISLLCGCFFNCVASWAMNNVHWSETVDEEEIMC